MLAADRPAPTPDAIRKLAAATVAAAADSVAATAGVLSLPTAGASAEFRVTGLSDRTEYVAYFTAQDLGQGRQIMLATP